MSSQDIHACSATTTPVPSVRSQEEVTELIDTSRCIGRKAYQVACSEQNKLRNEIGHGHGTYDNPIDLTTDLQTAIRFTGHENEVGNLEWPIRKDGCMHYVEPGCLKARPSPGAIVRYASGIVNSSQDKCVDCGYCITDCPFDIPRVSQKDHKAYKCSPCSDRVSVGMEPACVKTCPIGTIVFGNRKDTKGHAVERIVGLKSHGYENAGLYDPEGVGGTHVMYVLHHVDKPSLYVGLADQSSASPLVSLWKGVARPLALLAMGATVPVRFFYYVHVGPSRVDDEEDHGQVEAPMHQADPSVHTFDPHERR